jgi:hypothetical protein
VSKYEVRFTHPGMATATADSADVGAEIARGGLAARAYREGPDWRGAAWVVETASPHRTIRRYEVNARGIVVCTYRIR